MRIKKIVKPDTKQTVTNKMIAERKVREYKNYLKKNKIKEELAERKPNTWVFKKKKVQQN